MSDPTDPLGLASSFQNDLARISRWRDFIRALAGEFKALEIPTVEEALVRAGERVPGLPDATIQAIKDLFIEVMTVRHGCTRLTRHPDGGTVFSLSVERQYLERNLYDRSCYDVERFLEHRRDTTVDPTYPSWYPPNGSVWQRVGTPGLPPVTVRYNHDGSWHFVDSSGVAGLASRNIVMPDAWKRVPEEDLPQRVSSEVPAVSSWSVIFGDMARTITPKHALMLQDQETPDGDGETRMHKGNDYDAAVEQSVNERMARVNAFNDNLYATRLRLGELLRPLTEGLSGTVPARWVGDLGVAFAQGDMTKVEEIATRMIATAKVSP